ncbi:MAG: hypothetical protein LBD12_03575 [Clostridiales Family XIII bacterium]|jgi:hypothetical protein|nr:hypothetical protein [Clostridiales Family XIII bacterium]
MKAVQKQIPVLIALFVIVCGGYLAAGILGQDAADSRKDEAGQVFARRMGEVELQAEHEAHADALRQMHATTRVLDTAFQEKISDRTRYLSENASRYSLGTQQSDEDAFFLALRYSSYILQAKQHIQSSGTNPQGQPPADQLTPGINKIHNCLVEMARGEGKRGEALPTAMEVLAEELQKDMEHKKATFLRAIEEIMGQNHA